MKLKKKNSLHLEKFRINFDFIRLRKAKKDPDRKTRYTKKSTKEKKHKLTKQ